MTETPNPNKLAGYQSLINNFDGEIFANVQYFFTNLEDTGRIAQWNNQELLAVFKSKLKGLALKYFIEDPELLNEKDFQKVKTRFSKYFETKTSLSLRQQQFSNCSQNPGESVRSFAIRVSNLTVSYFGIENSSQPGAKVIVDQTKLAKFLEGLQPSLKRIALTRNPSSFEDAVENAVLDELNSQFATDIGIVSNCKTETSNNLERKMTEFLDKQAEASNHLIQTLADQVHKLSLQSTLPPYNNTPINSRNWYRTPAETYPRCIHCGRTNHYSSQCYLQQNQGSLAHTTTNRVLRGRAIRPFRPNTNNNNRSPRNRNVSFHEQPRESSYQSYSARGFRNNDNTTTNPKQRTPLNSNGGR